MDKINLLFKNKTFIYVLIAFFCIFLVCLASEYDYDLYARLIVGENFIEKGVFNYKDFYSYTPTHVWYDHEWGASIIFYVFLKLFGAFGLILVQGLTMFVTTFFAIKTTQLQKHPYPLSIVFVLLFLVLFFHQNPDIVRCQMFSFMFFSMFLYLLEKYRKTNSNTIWFLPLIVLFWNNIHGGVVAGIGTAFIYLISLIITRKPCKKLSYSLLASCGVMIINPYGWDYIKFLIMANTMFRKYVVEWWPVFSNRHIIYYYPQFTFCVFAMILAFVNIFKTKKLDLAKVSILLITSYMGIMHVKLLSLPLITIFALYYNEIMSLFESKKIKILNGLACFIMAVCVICIPFTHPLTPKTNIKKIPVKEVEFLKINDIRGNILSEFGFSSYIAYKLYPNNLIYLDGRYEEVYNDTEFNKLRDYELIEDNWQDILKDYPTEILMPEKKLIIYSVLEKNPDWVKIYEGDVCGIFVKKNAIKRKYLMPSDDIKYYQENEFKNMGYFRK